MNGELRLMAVLAHPDDESLGFGGTFARYAAEGVGTYLVTATRGERGRYYHNDGRPSDAEVGRVRERELRAAAADLGIREVSLLDYLDGQVDAAPVHEIVGRIAGHLRRVRPHVVITFGMDGAYGHPDHVAISQFTSAAVVAAADPASAVDGAPHAVAKLYHNGFPARIWDLYQRVFKRLVSVVDGVERSPHPHPGWMLTTVVDAREHWPQVWQAVQRHETQLAVYAGLGELDASEHALLWGEQHYMRMMSTVNGGRRRERDLFEGLR
jgi:LmbE family N-acetylglucosaminyl deacetylase